MSVRSSYLHCFLVITNIFTREQEFELLYAKMQEDQKDLKQKLSEVQELHYVTTKGPYLARAYHSSKLPSAVLRVFSV